MHPLQNGSQVAVKPTAKNAINEPGYFTEGGTGVPPSYPGADYFNAQIAEFNNMLAASGVEFDRTKFDHMTRMIGAIALKTTEEKMLRDQVGNFIYTSRTTPQPYEVLARGDIELSREVDAILWQHAQDSGLVVSQALKDADPDTWAGHYGDGDGLTTFTCIDLTRGHFVRGAAEGIAHGETQMDAMLKIEGRLNDVYAGGSVSGSGAFTRSRIGGIQSGASASNASANIFVFDSSNVVRTAEENRPKTLNTSAFIHRGHNGGTTA